MENSTLYKKIWTILGITITVLAAVLVGLQAMYAALPQPAAVAPAVSSQSVSNGSLHLLGSWGITQTVNGTADSVLGYTLQDCYLTFDSTTNNTTTVEMQHSADKTNWVTLYTFPDVYAAGTSFTHSVVYGAFERAIISAVATSTSPISVALTCLTQ